MIHFDKVFKYYSGVSPGLIDVSVEIPEGEFVFLIGPSGSGKTTFLRLLIRDLEPTSGIIKIDGHDIQKIRGSQVHLLRRKVGIVFQDFKLLHDRTVEENVAMVLEILGKSHRDIAHGVHNVLTVVGLDDKKHMFPQQLSAGEMQRASIARAIVGGPKILLADEPTGNLDPETAWGIMDIFQEVHSLGTTVVIASHNADIVNKLKKRTLTLHRGSVVRDEARGRYHIDKHERHDKKDDKGGKKDAGH